MCGLDSVFYAFETWIYALNTSKWFILISGVVTYALISQKGLHIFGCIYFLALFVQPELQVSRVSDLFDTSSIYLDQFAQQDELIPVVSLHFTIVKCFRPGENHRLYIKNVYLFRLNRTATNVELVSTRSFFCAPVYLLEVTNGFIKYAIPAVVYPYRSYLLFTFNLANGLWSFEIVHVFDAYRLPVPDFTSTLTIRCWTSTLGMFHFFFIILYELFCFILIKLYNLCLLGLFYDLFIELAAV